MGVKLPGAKNNFNTKYIPTQEAFMRGKHAVSLQIIDKLTERPTLEVSQ